MGGRREKFMIGIEGGGDNGRKEREVYDWERRRGWVKGVRREVYNLRI